MDGCSRFWIGVEQQDGAAGERSAVRHRDGQDALLMEVGTDGNDMIGHAGDRQPRARYPIVPGSPPNRRPASCGASRFPVPSNDSTPRLPFRRNRAGFGGARRSADLRSCPRWRLIHEEQAECPWNRVPPPSSNLPGREWRSRTRASRRCLQWSQIDDW